MTSEKSPYTPHMLHAITLANNAKWQTAPNPCVGAVLIKDDCIVASGWHKGTGTQHAEIVCLADAKEKNVAIDQCTLVVTLEPCSHYGKTPPCVNAILEAGIKKVVIGTLDPTSAGGGAAYLTSKNVEVIVGIAEDECLDLISDFLTWSTTDLPYTVIKLASTLDGRIATRTGHSKWITTETTRKCVHQLREHMHAVIVGGNTYYQDDPQLTCRLDSFLSSDAPQSIGVVVTSRLPEATSNSFLLRERPTSTMFWTTVAAAASPKAEALRRLGIQVLGLPSLPIQNTRGHGLRSALLLDEGLQYLRKELQCYYVLCEGGGKLALSILNNNLANELHLHMAPKILGDNEATPLFDGRSPLLMTDSLSLRVMECTTTDEDIILVLRPKFNIVNTPLHERVS